jgi:hypothetical protein
MRSNQTSNQTTNNQQPQQQDFKAICLKSIIENNNSTNTLKDIENMINLINTRLMMDLNLINNDVDFINILNQFTNIKQYNNNYKFVEYIFNNIDIMTFNYILNESVTEFKNLNYIDKIHNQMNQINQGLTLSGIDFNPLKISFLASVIALDLNNFEIFNKALTLGFYAYLFNKIINYKFYNNIKSNYNIKTCLGFWKDSDKIYIDLSIIITIEPNDLINDDNNYIFNKDEFLSIYEQNNNYFKQIDSGFLTTDYLNNPYISYKDIKQIKKYIKNYIIKHDKSKTKITKIEHKTNNKIIKITYYETEEETEEEQNKNILISELKPESNNKIKLETIQKLLLNIKNRFGFDDNYIKNLYDDQLILLFINTLTYNNLNIIINYNVFINSFNDDEIKNLCDIIKQIYNLNKNFDDNRLLIKNNNLINIIVNKLDRYLIKNTFSCYKHYNFIENNFSNMLYNITLIILFKNILKFNNIDIYKNYDEFYKNYNEFIEKSNDDFNKLLKHYNKYINNYKAIKRDITNTLKTIEIFNKSLCFNEFHNNIIKMSFCHDVFKNICLMVVLYDNKFVYDDIYKAINFLKFADDVNINNYYEQYKINVYNIQKLLKTLFKNDIVLNEIEQLFYYIYLNYNILIDFKHIHLINQFYY